MDIFYKSDAEVELMRKSAILVSQTIAEVGKLLKPGMTLLEVDRIAEDFILDYQGTPNFKGYEGFPNTACLSVNEAVVHGIPSDYELRDGDIISVDLGAVLEGFHGDSAYTFAIGNVSSEVLNLLKYTKESLELGIEKAVVGNRVGDIAYAIQHFIEKEHGYGVVRELVGHGLGRDLHEDPQIPNYGRRGRGVKLRDGLVICIEPMINLGGKEVSFSEDGWTVVTRDGLPSAHYEKTLAVRKHQADVLTDFSIIEAVERANPELNDSYLA